MRRSLAIAIEATSVLLCSLLAFTCIGCAMGPLAPRAMRATNEINGQRSATVALDVDCTTIGPKGITRVTWGASGLAMGERYILTAAHAVPVGCAKATITARFDDREGSYAMRVESAMFGDDIARLVVADGGRLPRFYVVRVGRVRVGDGVCLVAGEPKRRVECGRVTDTEGELPGDISHTALTVHGNSGSGLFNGRGELVGIVTHERHDIFDRPIGGRATSVSALGRRWIAAAGAP